MTEKFLCPFGCDPAPCDLCLRRAEGDEGWASWIAVAVIIACLGAALVS